MLRMRGGVRAAPSQNHGIAPATKQVPSRGAAYQQRLPLGGARKIALRAPLFSRGTLMPCTPGSTVEAVSVHTLPSRRSAAWMRSDPASSRDAVLALVEKLRNRRITCAFARAHDSMRDPALGCVSRECG